MLKWIFATALVISIGIIGYVYLKINEEQKVLPPTTAETPARSISIIHAFKDGEHRFSGQVRLPHSCYSLDAEAVHDMKDSNKIILVLTTTDKMLDQSLCAKIPTNYPFQILTDGAENITLGAKLNDEVLKINETKTDWQSVAGTYITPISK